MLSNIRTLKATAPGKKRGGLVESGRKLGHIVNQGGEEGAKQGNEVQSSTGNQTIGERGRLRSEGIIKRGGGRRGKINTGDGPEKAKVPEKQALGRRAKVWWLTVSGET